MRARLAKALAPVTANRNVALTMAFTVTVQIATSVLLGPVFTVYLFRVPGGTNSRVGALSAASGVAQLLVSLPAGWLTDKYPRSYALIGGALVGLAAVVASIAALLSHELWLFALMQVLWGCMNGVTDSALNSLFADSTPTGDRSALFSLKGALTEGAQGVGPLLIIGLFAFAGNEWGISEMQHVLLVGAVMFVLPLCLLFGFRDSRALGLESEAALASAAPGKDGATPLHAQDSDEAAEAEAHAARPPYGTFCGLTERSVPYFILASDIIFSLGAGMTVQYFALFYANVYGLRPIELQVLFAVVPATTFACIIAGQRLSRPLGRVPVMTLSRSAGFVCLFALAAVRPLWPSIALFVARTSLQRVASPLERSILMDLVPKAQRGRWNSLEGINAASWSGSAFVGGYLVDRFGYRVCFTITALVYVLATTLLLPSWYIIPRSEHALARVRTRAPEGRRSDAAVRQDAGALGLQPLLAPEAQADDGDGDASASGDAFE